MFAYLNYRAFLGDFYAYKKIAARGFSYRSFSRRAGLRAPNHLKRIIDGDRNLAPDTARKYTQALGLGGEAASFFLDLVAFNQAKSSVERNDTYLRLTGYREYRRVHKLDLAHAAYHSEWYVPAIRELAARSDFTGDPAWIARELVPPITRAQAAKALDVLLELRLLVRDADGRVVQGDEIVTTGAQTAGMHITNYHRAMLARAADAIDLVPASERDISSLTFAVSEEGLREIQERIRRFRRELIGFATEQRGADRVVQVGFQVFPLSRARERGADGS